MINPNIRIKGNFIDYPYFVNIGVLQNAAVLKNKGYKVKVVDMFSQRDSGVYKEGEYILIGSRIDTEKLIKKFEFDTAIITNSPFLKLFSNNNDKEISNLILQIKRVNKNAKIILADCYIGGMHYVDYDISKILKRYPSINNICKYESENCLIKLLEKSEEKSIQGHFVMNLDKLPLPDYDSISMTNYLSFLKKASKRGIATYFEENKNTIGLFTSRGCVYNCVFCSSRLYNRKYRQNSIGYIKKHLLFIKNNYKIEKVAILDEIANISEKRLENLLKVLNELGMDYEFANGLRADRISRKAIRLMKGHISMLTISAESGSNFILNKVIKKALNLDKVEQVAEWCKERCKIGGSFHDRPS